MLLLLLIVALAIGLFYSVLQLEISGTWKFFIIFAEMAFIGWGLIKQYKLPSEMGLILVKSKKGLTIIESLAKKEKLFNFMSDVGNAMAYGLLSKVIIKKGSIVSLVTGLFLLGVISFLVAPTAFVFLFKVMQIGTVEKSVSTLTDGVDFGLALITLILLVGGLSLFILAGVIFYGGVVLSAIIQTFLFGADTISGISPGGTFLLPGVNLPLFEGILALLVVLVAHEGAHAVLTRIAKIPLLSSGIVLFGIIPVGAFIEPDEKKLNRVDDLRQTRVLVAGPAANLLTSVVFFILFIGLVVLINNLEILQVGVIGSAAKFVYYTLGLTFALNFIVGAVNLLPLPLFDGFRVIDINIKNKTAVKALMYVTLFFFVLNFLPWLFR
ncbi:site-2 protease family protein [Candidatus Micrarchaeota archaeon]|nr:site-2 protease family protein [Candidatus Micrarchaeota archaeon]